MPKSVEKMMIVAAGSAEEVQDWRVKLHNAGIPCAITRSSKSNPEPDEEMEIWIDKASLQKAAVAIRRAFLRRLQQ
jgi:hypothetical protein